MRITINTEVQYKESTKEGVGYNLKIPAKTLARWSKVLIEYEEVQKDMALAYGNAMDKYLVDFKNC